MYEGKLYGENIRLKNAEYENILDFFNPDNVQKDADGDFFNNPKRGLVVCRSREHRCQRNNCPFEVFKVDETPLEEEKTGCIAVLDRIIGGASWAVFDNIDDGGYYFEKEGKTRRKVQSIVRKVYNKFLRNFTKVS